MHLHNLFSLLSSEISSGLITSAGKHPIQVEWGLNAFYSGQREGFILSQEYWHEDDWYETDWLSVRRDEKSLNDGVKIETNGCQFSPLERELTAFLRDNLIPYRFV